MCLLRDILIPVLALWMTVCAVYSQEMRTDSPPPTTRSQVNLESPWAYEYPFLNLIKNSKPWWTHGKNDGTVPSPTDVDENGYPLYDPDSVSFFGWTFQVRIPLQYSRPGNYVLTWTGAGDFNSIKEFSNEANGDIHFKTCTGVGGGRGVGFCSNTRCNSSREMKGYIVGTLLTITSADKECSLVSGQPISGFGITILKFGTPTIITGKYGSPNCPVCTGSGGTGTYLVNFSQMAGSSSNLIAINPGGRFEFFVTGESVMSHGDPVYDAMLSINLSSTGTSTNMTNTAQNIALIFTDDSGNIATDDEPLYWSGQIVGRKLKQILTQAKIGVIRDLGFTNNVFTNLTTWATRKPATYWSWQSVEMRRSLYAGVVTQRNGAAISFTGSIDGTTLTASNVGGALTVGQYLDAAHIQATISNGPDSASSVLNVTNVLDGTLAVGQTLYDRRGVIGSGIKIIAFGTGTGGRGTYTVSKSQNVSSAQLMKANGTDIVNVTNIGVAPRTSIASFGTGTGGSGTYKLNCSGCTQRVASETMSVVNYKYSVDRDSAPPADKETIIVKWQTDGPNPSENLFSADNGATYKPMINSGGVAYNSMDSVPVSGYFSTLVYDATLGGWMHWGGYYTPCCSLSPAVGLIGVVPPEVFIEFCNEVGGIPWITEPYMAADPLTDYMTQYALYIKENYPTMIPEFETPDETWNGSVDNAIYAAQKSNAYAAIDSAWADGLTVFNDDWTGKVASTMCQAISAVYNQDSTKYRCIDGVDTNAEWDNLRYADRRLLSTAYVKQNTAAIPIQSGCAGPGAIQNYCPAPFQQAPAYSWVTDVSVFSYWGVAEAGEQQEGADAYKFFYGETSEQENIMSSFWASALNPYQQDTLGTLDQVVWPAFYKWATSCAGHGSPCGVKGLVAYEGGYSQPLIGADQTLHVDSANNGSPCVLNTTTTVGGVYINDGRGSGWLDRTPGTFFSATVNLPMGGTLINVPGAPKILGYYDYQNRNYKHGYALSGSQYLAPTTVVVAANGAVPGMPVKISHASGSGSGTAWVSLNREGGTSFIIGPYPTLGAIPLLNPDGSNFDCSGYQTLTGLTLTYTGSANYINYLRNMSYISPQAESYTEQLYDAFYKYGGAGASQLNVANPNSVGTGWLLLGDDIYGYFAVGTSTLSTVSGRTLTLGGNVSGRFQIGQTLFGGGLPSGRSAITITGYISGKNGTAPGDKLNLSDASPTAIVNRPVNSTVTTFPLLMGLQKYNAKHGGYLLWRDINPEGENFSPAFLEKAA